MSVNRAQRVDLEVVADLIPPQSRVLDVGSGDGLLLELLQETKQVDGRGLELSQRGVNECVARGLSVIQGDADRISNSIPTKDLTSSCFRRPCRQPATRSWCSTSCCRIGNRAIVSFPNFGHWRVRLSLFLNGRMPVTRDLPYSWYDTPNIHFCTIRDFVNLCDELGATVEKATALDANGQKIGLSMPWWFWNFFGQQAVFLLKR